jgi:hypothetical protein
LIDANEDVKELRAVTAHVRKLLIHGSSLFNLVLGKVILPQSLCKLVILWVKVASLLQVAESEIILVE